VTVAVIGAGPAGLAVAAALRDEGVEHVVFERGDTPLAALRTIDPEIQLLTPTRLSRLPGMPKHADDPPYLRFGALVGELDAWRSVPVATKTLVERVDAKPDGDGFVVHHGGRTLAATHVVNATGIIGHPHVPPDTPPRTRWLHSVAVRSADLAASRKLLVVGAGMSAAEVVERWLELHRPGDQLWLSTSGRVRATPQAILGLDVHYWLAPIEWLPGRLLGRRVAPDRDLVIGRATSRALAAGTVARTAPVAQYDGDEVVLADSTRVAPDLVVFATGFRYAAPHLGELVDRDPDGYPLVDRHARSTRNPRLYLLGLRFGRSVASPYLRGIARDATHVAAHIGRSLR
jgi:cation diffusion facilitator CzcD-associated flavoprotein CzcO